MESLIAQIGGRARCWSVWHMSLVKVMGHSMYPGLLEGDRVIYRTRSRLSAGPRLGSIVVFPLPTTRGCLLIKRVSGTEGDAVPVGDAAEMRIVPAGHLYVLGDNPEWSLDSRQFGTIPKETVVGVVLWRIRVGGKVPPAEPPRVFPLSYWRHLSPVERNRALQ